MKIILLFVTSTLLFADINITVEGMTCISCTEKLKASFEETPGITSIDAKLEEKLITIKMKEEDKLTDKVIKDIITSKGYEVSKIDRD